MRNRVLRRGALALGSVIAAVAMPFALAAPASAATDAKQLPPYWGHKIRLDRRRYGRLDGSRGAPEVTYASRAAGVAIVR